MKNKYLILLFSWMIFFSSQGADLIDQGEGWKGDSVSYSFENNELSLAASKEGKTTLFKSIELQDSVSWVFEFSYQFSPSASNRFRLYFIADQQEEETLNNGLYVEVGESGNNDGLSLFKVENGITTLIQKIGKGVFASSKKSVVVLLSKQGNDYRLGTVGGYECYFSFSYKGLGSNVGLFNTYTKSNIEGFVMSRIFYGKDPNKGLAIESAIYQKDSGSLKVLFTHDLLGLNLQKVELNNGGAFVSFQVEGKCVVLPALKLEPKEMSEFTFSFSTWEAQELKILLSYTYRPVESFDLIFTEIMFDPFSNTGLLQEEQYVELYNRSDRTLDLTDVHLLIDADTVRLGKGTIEPASYAVFYGVGSSVNCCNQSNEFLLDEPLRLKQQNGRLILQQGGTVLDQLTYNKSYYEQDFKAEGGWSIALKCLDRYCDREKAWGYSSAFEGGTPGRVNNSCADCCSDEHLWVSNLSYISDSALLLTLNKNISPLGLSKTMLNSDQLIESFVFQQNYLNKVIVEFKEVMQKGELYTIGIGEVPYCDHRLGDQKQFLEYGIPSSILHGDVLLNEIHCNPLNSKGKYIEIVNVSKKVLKIDDLLLANFTALGQPVATYEIEQSGALLLPGDYLCLTDDASQVLIDFPNAVQDRLKEVKKMPSMGVANGNVGLVKRTGEEIDFLGYASNWHSNVLGETKGVSLERIAASGATNDSTNWTSASFEVNYGTPGYQNSNASEGDSRVNERGFFLANNVVILSSVDLRQLIINYNIGVSGYVLSAKLFTASGLEIGFLCENALLGTTGQLVFDLQETTDYLLTDGVYIVCLNATHDKLEEVSKNKNVSILN